ncbi:MAG: S8 family serine peptidase [Bacteroidetes bacterium]|nr:S8 family serine peptidase [Bacteroidota bacterium]
MKNIQRYHIILAITLIVVSAVNISVGQNKYRLQLRSGEMVPAENFEETSQLTVMYASDVYAQQYFRVMQFYAIPLQPEKEAMEAMGIKFLSYIPNYAYIVSIPVNLDLTKLSSYGVRSIITMDRNMKLNPALLDEIYPYWALQGQDEIDIILNYYKHLDQKEILNELQRRHVEVLHKNSMNKITIRIGIERIDEFVEAPYVSYMEPVYPPSEPENLVGRTNHRSSTIATDYSTGRHYDGTGVNVMLQDDGIIGPHIDYEGRITQYPSNNSGDHGDHCGGIIMGAGNKDPDARGMAFGANIHVYRAIPYTGFDSITAHYASKDVFISSTSYSNGCNDGYTSLAQTMDIHVRTMTSLMHVFSAGNRGSNDCGYGAGAGWGNVTGGHKIGKNVIAVANITHLDALNGSSSKGPAHDGRIKPDIAAVGTTVYSTVDENDYDYKTGTSMSCPGVAGTLAQLYQAYQEINLGNPASGLMKAILLNTADDLGNAGPDFKFGWGRINGIRAMSVIENGMHLDSSIAQGATNTHVITVPANTAELKIMVYWTDYEGTVNTTKALVNDLNMTVTDPGSAVHLPWLLDHTPNSTALNTPATTGVDSMNNMEQVLIDNPVAGNYTVDISGFLVPQGPQDYFIVYAFMEDGVELTYPIGGEPFKPVEIQILRWDAHGTSGDFDIDYSEDAGSTWSTIATGVDSTQRSYSWNVPNTFSGDVLVRITRNGISDTSNTTFSIAPVPNNLNITWACPDSFMLTWNNITGATGYEISMLGNKYMDSIGTDTNNSYIVRNVNPIDTYWVAVKVLGPNNAVGKRTIAIQKLPGTFGCVLPVDAKLDDFISPVGGTIFGCYDLTQVMVSIKIKNEGDSTLTNVPVHYNLNGAGLVTETYTGTLTTGSSATYNFTATVDLSALGTHVVQVWVAYPADNNFYNDSATSVINTISAASVNLPWTDDFESFALCNTSSNCALTICPLAGGWINETNGDIDDIDWRTNSATTPSNGTGPAQDHKPGNLTGKYIYLEASGGCSLREAMVVSPCIDLTTAGAPELTFWYNMNGVSMGSLHLDISTGTSWTEDIISPISGNKGSSWFEKSVDLTAYAGSIINLRFRGITGSGYLSDLALDDIVIVDVAVAPVAAISSDAGVCKDSVVIFTDISTGPPSTYSWDFGSNATPAIANSKGPHSVSYSTTGTKDVTLIVSNIAGTDTLDYNMLVSSAAPSGSFSYLYSFTPFKVDFTDLSSDASSWSWDFGDGKSDNSQNPGHTYSTGGSYTVTLIATNGCGSDTVEQTITVTGIEDIIPEASIIVYPNPSSGSFVVNIQHAVDNLNALSITDLSGKIVFVSGSADLEALATAHGAYKIQIDLSNQPKSLYFLHLLFDNGTYHAKITVQ